MQFEVLSRTRAEQRAPDVPYIIISIKDRDAQKPRLPNPPTCLGRLALVFDALDQPVEGFDLFTEAHAQHILQFVGERLGQIDLIVVHCELGRNRSAAVAAALCRLINGYDERFFVRYEPCRYVYESLLAYARKTGWKPRPVSCAMPAETGADG